MKTTIFKIAFGLTLLLGSNLVFGQSDKKTEVTFKTNEVIYKENLVKIEAAVAKYSPELIAELPKLIEHYQFGKLTPQKKAKYGLTFKQKLADFENGKHQNLSYDISKEIVAYLIHQNYLLNLN